MTTVLKDDPSQDVAKYIAAITAQYDAALKFIDAMEADSTGVANDEQTIADKQLVMWAALGDREAIKELAALRADEAKLNGDLTTQENALAALDPAFKGLDNTMESFLQIMNGLLSKGGSSSDVVSDINQILGYLNQLFTAMRQKLNADKDSAIISNDVEGQLSDDQLEKFAAQMIGNEGSEQATLGTLTNTMQTDFVAFHQQYDNAKADHARYNIFDEIFGNGDEQEYRDDQIMANATAMMDGIYTTLGDLNPEIASLMPEFIQIQTILKSVMKRVQKILSDIHLSPNQKASALLSLMMFALGVFNMIGQEVQQEKAHNEKKMADANIATSRMNMDDTVMNQKIQEEEAAKAALMKTVMMVSQIILGGIMTLMAPGLGSALLMMAFTALEATGEMDKATKQLAGVLLGSQIAAEVLIGVAEIAVTCGGGEIGDRMVAKMAKTAVEDAVKAAEAAVQEAVEKAAETAAASAGKAGEKGAITAAKNTIDKVVKQAAETAAKRTAEQIANQPLPILFKFLTQGGRDAARQTMVKAATEAAGTAVEASADIATLAALGQSSEAALAEIALRAGNKAAASAAGVSEETIEKAARSQGSKFRSRLGMAVAFNTVNSDYLIQLCEAIQKARGKGNDSHFEGFLTFINVFKQILQSIILMYGSGMLSTMAFSQGGATQLMRIANGISMLPQGANAMAAYGQTSIYESQAKATTALAKNQTIADLLHSYLDQMQKDLNVERDRFIRQQQQELRSDEAMSGHLLDGDMAGIQVLMASAG